MREKGSSEGKTTSFGVGLLCVGLRLFRMESGKAHLFIPIQPLWPCRKYVKVALTYLRQLNDQDNLGKETHESRGTAVLEGRRRYWGVSK